MQGTTALERKKPLRPERPAAALDGVIGLQLKRCQAIFIKKFDYF